MESLISKDMLSLDESFDGPDVMAEDNDCDSCSVVLPCVGRGLKMISISEIKLPAEFYASVQPAVPSVQVSPQVKPQHTSGKGRAQLIHEDKIKCFRPVRDHPSDGSSLPSGNNMPGGDYRPSGSSKLVENNSSHSKAQQSTSFDEDFPPLSDAVLGKPSVTPEKTNTSRNSR